VFHSSLGVPTQRTLGLEVGRTVPLGQAAVLAVGQATATLVGLDLGEVRNATKPRLFGNEAADATAAELTIKQGPPAFGELVNHGLIVRPDSDLMVPLESLGEPTESAPLTRGRSLLDGPQDRGRHVAPYFPALRRDDEPPAGPSKFT
jgi:hypothetical protein